MTLPARTLPAPRRLVAYLLSLMAAWLRQRPVVGSRLVAQFFLLALAGDLLREIAAPPVVVERGEAAHRQADQAQPEDEPAGDDDQEHQDKEAEHRREHDAEQRLAVARGLRIVGL